MEHEDGTSPSDSGIGKLDRSIGGGGDDGASGGTGGGGGGGVERIRLSERFGSGGGKDGRRVSAGKPKTPDDESLASFLNDNNNEVDKRPRSVYAPSTRQPKGKATPEDVEDLRNLVIGSYAGVAVMTGFGGWQMSEDEASAIAKPAARILARHTAIQAAVREVADPVALMVAVGLPTLARYAMWQQWKGQTKGNVSRPIPPPQQSTENPQTNLFEGSSNPFRQGTSADSSATISHLQDTI